MYAMVAAGLALMLGVARLINFAHGEFFMLGAYAFWLGYSELGLPYPVAALLAPAVMVLFRIAYQRTVIRAILPRSWHVQLIATLATSIVLTNLAIIVLGPQPQEGPTALSARILHVGGFPAARQRRDRRQLPDRAHRGAGRQLRVLRLQGRDRLPDHDRGAALAATGPLRPPDRDLTCGGRARSPSSSW